MRQGGFEVNLDCFLWDLVDEGVEEALDRIKGETGVTGIVVPVHGGGLRQFRPHPGVSPRSYEYDGGALFQPDSSQYRGTRIRPVVFEGIRKANPLKTVVQACHDRGLRVGCGVAACHCRPAAERHGHATVLDVLGDRDYWLCPVNPDVQEYVRSVLTDLIGNYGLDSIRLSHIGFPWSSGSNPVTRFNEHHGFVMGPLELWLRTICFCESCRQLAKRDGIDVDSAARVAGDVLNAACRTGSSSRGDVAGFVEAHDALDTYLRWRTSQLHRWICTLKTACGCTLVVEDHPEHLRSGISLQDIPDAYDVVLLRCREPAALGADSSQAGRDWEPSRISAWFSAGAECPNSDALVRGVVQAAKSGCHSASVGDYGSVPLERLEWIRQAVRFARRETL
jgi:hypothetical protein